MPPVNVASVPGVLPVLPKASLTYCPSIPPTVNTANGEPSLTVTSFIVNTRSSFGNALASVGLTTPAVGVGAVTVGITPLTGADSSTPAVDGLLATNTVPVPSSLMVTLAGVAATPLVLVAVKLNGSLLSEVPSCSGASNTRTNALPLPSSGIKLPAV